MKQIHVLFLFEQTIFGNVIFWGRELRYSQIVTTGVCNKATRYIFLLKALTLVHFLEVRNIAVKLLYVFWNEHIKSRHRLRLILLSLCVHDPKAHSKLSDAEGSLVLDGNNPTRCFDLQVREAVWLHCQVMNFVLVKVAKALGGHGVY